VIWANRRSPILELLGDVAISIGLRRSACRCRISASTRDRDARECRRRHLAAVGELFEHAASTGSIAWNVFLGDEAHLEIEL